MINITPLYIAEVTLKYEASINKFIGESLNVNWVNPNLFDRLKLKFCRVNIERKKTENPFKEIVRVYKNKKLISEREFILTIKY